MVIVVVFWARRHQSGKGKEITISFALARRVLALAIIVIAAPACRAGGDARA